MTSALSIISDAYLITGVTNVGSAITADMKQQGMTCLNQILGQWSLMPLTVPVTVREVFPLVGGQGGPSNPYTIGPGGDFDTVRPAANGITDVGLLVTSVAEPFEIPRTVYTNDAYASITQKDLESSYFTGLSYEPTSTDGRGQIYLWPVPSDASTSLVLYRGMQLAEFTSITNAYDFPPGAVPALTYELARWLSMRFHGSWSPQLEQMANQFMAIYQRANTVMTDLGLDAALTSGAGVYNILTDTVSS